MRQSCLFVCTHRRFVFFFIRRIIGSKQKFLCLWGNNTQYKHFHYSQWKQNANKLKRTRIHIANCSFVTIVSRANRIGRIQPIASLCLSVFLLWLPNEIKASEEKSIKTNIKRNRKCTTKPYSWSWNLVYYSWVINSIGIVCPANNNNLHTMYIANAPAQATDIVDTMHCTPYITQKWFRKIVKYYLAKHVCLSSVVCYYYCTIRNISSYVRASQLVTLSSIWKTGWSTAT